VQKESEITVRMRSIRVVRTLQPLKKRHGALLLQHCRGDITHMVQHSRKGGAALRRIAVRRSADLQRTW
tara:strand:+ start:737 stop:943 length:207 start_codon:yes stop_codon:yes gene_type:complete